MKTWLKRQWKRRTVRAAVAVFVGAMASFLCGYLPDTFKVPCHAAAKICQVVFGGSQ